MTSYVESWMLVRAFREEGIRLIAIDFDNTLVGIHTSGIWPETPNAVVQLANAVRPVFKVLIPTLINNGFYVAVVTFSTQSELIKASIVECFQRVLPILVQGSDFGVFSGFSVSMAGKERHINMVANHIMSLYNDRLGSSEILLIDDNYNNVDVARQYGHKAIHFHEGHRTVRHILSEFNHKYGNYDGCETM
ncbi:hypothetical protein ACOME3_009809 [Neoechinorhynchus agilis]